MAGIYYLGNLDVTLISLVVKEDEARTDVRVFNLISRGLGVQDQLQLHEVLEARLSHMRPCPKKKPNKFKTSGVSTPSAEDLDLGKMSLA